MNKYTITQGNLHIIDSYQVSKKAFRRQLASIKALHPDSDVWKRSWCSLELEWATHNGLYAIGIARSHTKDVDLNYPQKWYEKVLYPIVGSVCWIFIK